MSRLLYLGFLLLLAGLLAGASGCSGSETAQPTKTVTQTESRTPSGEESTASQPPSSEPDPAEERETEEPEAGPESTVRSYFDAVDAQDYQRAWELGGEHLAGSYDEYVGGFADTLDNTVVVLDTEGGTVSVRLTATQSDGSTKEFAGTYTVRDGQIVGADIREVSGSQPEESGGVPPYENCDEVREAGEEPLFPGDPGYTEELDRDGDGKACEWDRRE